MGYLKLDSFVEEKCIPAQMPRPNSLYVPSSRVCAMMGDMHGSFVSLFYFLTYYHLTEMHSETYAQWVALEKKCVEGLDSEDILKINALLHSKVTFKPGLPIFGGDEFCDRRGNDWVTLCIFKTMVQKGILFDSLFSNHTAELLINHEMKRPYNEFVSLKNGEEVGVSMVRLEGLINRGIVTRKDVDEMIEKFYKPRVIIIRYVLSEDKKCLAIKTHAGIGLNEIRNLAELLSVRYQDDTAENLARTIDNINVEFKKNSIARLCEIPVVQMFIWNRDYKLLDRPTYYNGYRLYFIHCHDKYDPYGYGHIITLDNDFGKISPDRAEDFVSLMIKKVKLKLIEEKKKETPLEEVKGLFSQLLRDAEQIIQEHKTIVEVYFSKREMAALEKNIVFSALKSLLDLERELRKTFVSPLVPVEERAEFNPRFLTIVNDFINDGVKLEKHINNLILLLAYIEKQIAGINALTERYNKVIAASGGNAADIMTIYKMCKNFIKIKKYPITEELTKILVDDSKEEQDNNLSRMNERQLLLQIDCFCKLHWYEAAKKSCDVLAAKLAVFNEEKEAKLAAPISVSKLRVTLFSIVLGIILEAAKPASEYKIFLLQQLKEVKQLQENEYCMADPDYFKLRLCEASIYEKLTEYEKAIQIYQLIANRGKYELCVAAIIKLLIQIPPSLKECYFLIEDIFSDIGRAYFMLAAKPNGTCYYANTIEHYRRIAVFFPQHEAVCLVQIAKGFYLRNKGSADLKMAWQMINKAITQFPDHYLAYVVRASLWIDNSNYIEGLKDCEKALEVCSSDSQVYFLKGVVMEALKERPEHILKVCEKGLKLSPNNSQLLEQKERNYARLFSAPGARAESSSATLSAPAASASVPKKETKL